MSEYAGPEPGEDYFAGSAITDWAAEHLERGQSLLDSSRSVMLNAEAATAHQAHVQSEFLASIAVSLFEISHRPIAPLMEVPQFEATPSLAEHQVPQWMFQQSAGPAEDPRGNFQQKMTEAIEATRRAAEAGRRAVRDGEPTIDTDDDEDHDQAEPTIDTDDEMGT
jgi:hypothetical protein